MLVYLEYRVTYQEQDWLVRVAEGDHQAFAALLLEYHPLAYRTALKLTNDVWQAEDVVQEVFLKVWLKRSTLPEIENFRAWLVTITTHVIYDMLRKQHAEKGHLASWVKELEPLQQLSQQTMGEGNAFEELVSQAVERLSPKQRQAFSLIKKEGYSRDEAAKLMQVSPETVKSHLDLAMRSIRAYCISRIGLGVLLLTLAIARQKYF